MVFDKLDWHLDGALGAGQPLDRAFAHIGLYLGWLVRHDMTSADMIRGDWVDAITRGEMVGSDLASAVDGVLAADQMTAEGAAFTASYYERYLDDFAESFPGSGPYEVSDDETSYARIEPVIDERYRAWVAAGRPQPVTKTEPAFPVADGPDPPGLRALREGDLEAVFDQLGSRFAERGWTIERPAAPPPLPRSARGDELEEWARSASPQPPFHLMSRPADVWGDALLKRALKRLEVAPKDVTVTTAMWSGPVVTLYDVPGASAEVLREEFATVVQLPPGTQAWTDDVIAGKRVSLARGREFSVAFWSRDGLVIHTAVTDPADLTDFVARLP